jgi:CubicO group peptidase (beta-lactamase class C family)
MVADKDVLKSIDNIIRQNLKIHKITGASVSIVDGNEMFYSKGFGFADKANKKLVNSDTIFRIGSITKVFTASAIMQLAEQGKINIDKPVKDYLADFSVKSRFFGTREITIRDLLCHHSGLPCDDFSNYFSPDPEKFRSAKEYLANAYLVTPPGKIFYYSNLGVNLLGIIIEEVTRMPFYEYIEKAILNSLRMTRSSIILKDELEKNISKPYDKGKEQVENMMKYIPSGGIYSSANDMAKFMMSIINGGKELFQNETTLDNMLIPQYPDNPLDFNFINGLGWFIGKPGLDYSGKVIWHDGGTPNFFSLTVIIPERKLGITILTNSKSGALLNHQISTDILKILLNSGYNIQPPGKEEEKNLEIAYNDILTETDRFITLSGIASIVKSGKKIIAKLPSGTFLMHHCKDNWFRLSLLIFGFFSLRLKQLSKLRLSIQKIDGEKILVMEQLGFRSPIGRIFKKLNSTVQWEKMAGYYICINEDNPRIEKFRFCKSKDGICISVSTDKMGHLKFYLDIINDSEAIIFGYGRYSGETVFVTDDNIIFSGLKFRRYK